MTRLALGLIAGLASLSPAFAEDKPAVAAGPAETATVEATMTDAERKAFRDEVRRFLDENLPARGLSEWNRKLREKRWVGFSWPIEYGGQGLGVEHQQVFDEESADYVLPDLGIAGVVTRIVCANVMLAHASEDFKRRHLPRIARGDELHVRLGQHRAQIIPAPAADANAAEDNAFARRHRAVQAQG